MVLTYLTQAAQVASRDIIDMSDYKIRMTAQGKPVQVLITDPANKLLRTVLSLTKNDCDYEPKHELKRQQRIASGAIAG